MLGREADLVHVLKCLADSRLVSLTGIGGTGKTRLALAAAAGSVDDYPDGVWFVDLVLVVDEDDLAAAIAGPAGLDLGAGDPFGSLIGLMSERQALFVLDNCEHLTDGVSDLVDAVLETVEGPTLFVASREPFNLPEERHIPLQLLDLWEESGPAVELFVSTAERAGVEVSEADRIVVGEICRALDGLPLAIELAAGQLRHLAVADLAERLDRRFELLDSGRGRRRRRQASLDVVLQGSWELLSEPEQELLRQMAAFPGRFSLEEAEIVAGSSITHSLAGLVDRALVTPSADRCEYRLLETVKLFARRSWEQVGDPDRYLDGHAEWLLDTIDGWDEDTTYMSYAVAGWHMSASSAALTAMSRIERTLGIEDLSLGVVPRLELAMAGAAMTARLPGSVGRERCSGDSSRSTAQRSFR
ncbi:MAG: putative ATPase [Candidatus Poriferisodalaceae bacterium]|jgi:predicted ATPase